MNENEGNNPTTPLLRRRRLPSRENSEEDVKPRILKLELKRKDSNVDLTEELNVIVDEVDGKEHKDEEKIDEGLLTVKKTTFWGLIASELTRFVEFILVNCAFEF